MDYPSDISQNLPTQYSSDVKGVKFPEINRKPPLPSNNTSRLRKDIDTRYPTSKMEINSETTYSHERSTNLRFLKSPQHNKKLKLPMQPT